MELEFRMKLCVTELDFPGKLFVTQKNGPKMGQKQVFFEFIRKFNHYFFLNLVYKEILYLLYHCRNPLLGKNLVPEICAKMLSTNQIAVFLN